MAQQLLFSLLLSSNVSIRLDSSGLHMSTFSDNNDNYPCLVSWESQKDLSLSRSLLIHFFTTLTWIIQDIDFFFLLFSSFALTLSFSTHSNLFLFSFSLGNYSNSLHNCCLWMKFTRKSRLMWESNFDRKKINLRFCSFSFFLEMFGIFFTREQWWTARKRNPATQID